MGLYFDRARKSVRASWCSQSSADGLSRATVFVTLCLLLPTTHLPPEPLPRESTSRKTKRPVTAVLCYGIDGKMYLLVTTKTKRTPGPVVEIHCPTCGANSVPAQSVEQLDTIGLFYVIPLLWFRNTFVRCSVCGKDSVSKIKIDEIGRYSADDLALFLARRTSFLSSFLAVASLIICWLPFFGLVFAVVAVLSNLRSRGWARAVSWTSMIIATLATVAVSVSILLEGT